MQANYKQLEFQCQVCAYFILNFSLTYTGLYFYGPAFAYVNGHTKHALQVHFIYLGNKEIYCIFKMCCIIPVVSHFPQILHIT